MALPNQIDPAHPADSDNPRQGDNEVRDLKTAVSDLFGVPNVTLINAPLGGWSTAGLRALQLEDSGIAPAAAGVMGVNGTALMWHDGTAAREIRRRAGTPVSVADGGTGFPVDATHPAGAIPAYTGTTTMADTPLLTSGGLLVGRGAGAVPVPSIQPTNGQLPIGSTGGDIVFGVPTVVNGKANTGPGSLEIAVRPSYPMSFEVYAFYAGLGPAPGNSVLYFGVHEFGADPKLMDRVTIPNTAQPVSITDFWVRAASTSEPITLAVRLCKVDTNGVVTDTAYVVSGLAIPAASGAVGHVAGPPPPLAATQGEFFVCRAFWTPATHATTVTISAQAAVSVR